MNIIKRNGNEVEFDRQKIVNAITAANQAMSENNRIKESDIATIAASVESQLLGSTYIHSVEEIQDMVELELQRLGAFQLAKSYMIYRYQHQVKRSETQLLDKIGTIIDGSNKEISSENANKNAFIVSTQRDYMAGECSKMYVRERLFTDENKDILEADDAGIIHIHDKDYIAQKMYNCCLINLDDMLQNGTVISGSRIDKPHSFTTAANVATQIMAQVASAQYGGQTINVYHLSKFVDEYRQRYIKRLQKRNEELGLQVTQEQFDKMVEMSVADEIEKGVQMIQYQINTLQTTNGQSPFASLFIYFEEAKPGRDREDLVLVTKEILKQRIKGIKNKAGTWVAPTFPKILYVLSENNCKEGTPYWEVTKLAAECTAKRMVPDYISEKKMKEYKEGNVYGCMGCRSFLSVWKDPETNKPKFWGRFNKGVVTINLPDVAFTIRDKYGDNSFNNNAAVAEFWKLLDERLEMCHRALLMRCRYLEGTPSDVAPILWQAGAIARLKPGETIDKLLKGGYSTASLGYVGLWETSKALSGKRHTDPEMIEFCKQIVKHMKEKCDEWNEIPDQNYGFSLYGTPEESTTFKFAKRLMTHKTLPGVNDKNYIMNSYHMDIREGLNHGVDAFTKLSTESEFQKYTNGGAVSYVETSHMENNIPAVLAIMDHIYENILYAEINSKFDNCHKCGYSGEIELVDNGKGHLIWRCPNCGNTDTAEMTIIRRICGYCAGANDMNEGRKGDIKGRELNV